MADSSTPAPASSQGQAPPCPAPALHPGNLREVQYHGPRPVGWKQAYQFLTELRNQYHGQWGHTDYVDLTENTHFDWKAC